MYNKRSLMLMGLLFLGSTPNVMGMQRITTNSMEKLVQEMVEVKKILQTWLNQQQPSTLATAATFIPVFVTLISSGYMLFKGLKDHFKKKQSPIINIATETAWENQSMPRELRQALNKIEFALTKQNIPSGLQYAVDNMPMALLLHGNPGTGKTYMAQLFAKRLQSLGLTVNITLITGTDILTKWVGGIPENIRKLYPTTLPKGTITIIIIDEIDVLMDRSRSGNDNTGQQAVTALLAELDGIRKKSGYITLGTTNQKKDADGNLKNIDPALIRPGRFQPIEITTATEDERKEIIKNLIKDYNIVIAHDAVDFVKNLHLNTENFTPADLKSLLVQAGLTSVMNDQKTLTLQSIRSELSKMTALSKMTTFKENADSNFTNLLQMLNQDLWTQKNLQITGTQERPADVQADTYVEFFEPELNSHVEFNYSPSEEEEEEAAAANTAAESTGGGGGGSKE